MTLDAPEQPPPHYTEVRFASFLSGRFITAIVVNPPERKLTKHTSVHYVQDRRILFKNCDRVKLRCFQSAFNRSDFGFLTEFEPEGLGSSTIRQNDCQMKRFDLIFLDKSISLIVQP